MCLRLGLTVRSRGTPGDPVHTLACSYAPAFKMVAVATGGSAESIIVIIPILWSRGSIGEHVSSRATHLHHSWKHLLPARLFIDSAAPIMSALKAQDDVYRQNEGPGVTCIHTSTEPTGPSGQRELTREPTLY